MRAFGIVIIGFLTLHLGSALTCYSCDSSKGVNCNYGLLSFTYNTVECKANSGSFLDSVANLIPSNCVKLVGIDKDGSEYIARSCGMSTGPINNCDIIAKATSFADDKHLDKLDCYTCEGDKCNSGDRASVVSLMGFVMACIAFLI